MIKLLLIAVAGFSTLLFWGCSGGAQENSNANANTEAVTQFTDARAALAEGTRLFDENQLDAAIAVFQQAVQLDPELAEAHFKLGIAYALQERQMQQTGAGIPIVMGADGKTPKTNSELAFEKAVETYNKWLEANPDDDVARFNLGRTYSKLLKDEEAEKEFKRAVKLKPEETEYQTELGNVLIRLAKYHEAIAPLKKAIELDPSNDRAIALLEDAEAGRQRLDYVGPKNTNSNTAANANSNTNSNGTGNSNIGASNARPPANARPANAGATPGREVPRSRVVNSNRPK